LVTTRKELRVARARDRLDEIAAMKTLLYEHQVPTRSSRHIELGTFPDLPWIGDVAESYGLVLVKTAVGDIDRDDEPDELTAYLEAIGIHDELEAVDEDQPINEDEAS
jgi:hypothetical protein